MTRRVDDRVAAIVIAAAIVFIGVHWGVKAAGGSDSYGYVSQAELWLSGHLTIQRPWLARIPWPDAGSTFSPLGYLPGVGSLEIVPKYAPGLPMLMALAKYLGGQAAVFWVVPLSAGVLVLATFGIGRRLGMSRAGVIAAWLVATSPTVLYMVVQPMTDVPVAAVWALAFWCLFGRGVWWTAAAGLAVGVAILIRPNLVPMAGLPLLWLAISAWRSGPAERRGHVVQAAAFVTAALPGVVATAALNTLWYGSPFRSGYEPLNELFRWSHVLPNIKNYALWFSVTQTPFALLGIIALLDPRLRVWSSTSRRDVLLMALFVILVWLEYCAYSVFDAWWYLRFLLPCWPFVMLGLAAGLVRSIGRRPAMAVTVTIFALCLGLNGLRVAHNNFAFDLQRGEDKYPTIAKLVQQRTGVNSVIFSMQHSGSIQYYGGRMTLFFPTLEPARLDRAVLWLSERGVHPYALLEDWEVEEFQRRFGEKNVMGKLEIPPALIYRGTSTAYLYDLQRPVGVADFVEEFVDDPSKPLLYRRPVPLATPIFKFE